MYMENMQVHEPGKLCVALTPIGVGTLVLSIIFYPSFLPAVITEKNSTWIQQVSYIFYGLLFGSIIMTAIGIHRTYRVWRYRIDLSLLSSTPQSPPPPTAINSPPISITKIIINILDDKKYFRFFWPASIGYGIIYAMISSMLIYRSENFSYLYGVTIPSIVITSYGPIGYVPTIAAYFTDHVGLLIIPINLVVILLVSALVGVNMVFSIYAFKNRPKKSTTTPFLGVLGATTGLFAACPTCASFYIFSIIAGSLAPTITAFTVTFYALFIVISIPLLVFTPFITVLSIRKMQMVAMSSQCSIDNRRI
jgi:hypothetical protein